MEGLNNAFIYVCDRIVSLQSFFMGEARVIGWYVLAIALSLAGINYALTGQGLKENLIKIGKAVVFFLVIMEVYPSIIGRITEWTFEKAHASTYRTIESQLVDMQDEFIDEANLRKAYLAEIAEIEQEYPGYIEDALAFGRGEIPMWEVSIGASLETLKLTYKYPARIINGTHLHDPSGFFKTMIQTREYEGMEYTYVAPAEALKAVMMIAGACIDYSDAEWYDFAAALKGIICAFFVMFTGVFAILEYVMAFLEYMLVTSVGIIMFPLSIWEGSKFLAEKLIGAIIGFFIKLLFINVCIFLMLYGYWSLAANFITAPFEGQTDSMITIIFISLMFFLIVKSAPALAQSLLTGTPSLSATGAIGAVTSAIAAGAGVFGMVKAASGSAAGGAAKAAFAGAGAVSQATGAAGAVKTLGGGFGEQVKAFFGSMGESAAQGVLSSGSELTRSLVSPSRGGGGGGNGGGINRHSQSQRFFSEQNADGTKESFKAHLQNRYNSGVNQGQERMLRKEQKKQQ